MAFTENSDTVETAFNEDNAARYGPATVSYTHLTLPTKRIV